MAHNAGAGTTHAFGQSVAEAPRDGLPIPPRDLEDATSVATALLGLGGMRCAPDQLAAAMKQTPTSGSLKAKVRAAKMFGLIEMARGQYHLTDLGFAITDEGRSRAARAQAFLNVPVFRRIYDEFRNKQLPPRPAGLEHTFVKFGVPSDQKEKARLIFDGSAEQGGYFTQGGRDRLIAPVDAGSSTTPTASDDGHEVEEREPSIEYGGGNGTGGGRRGPPNGLHPFILGLLETLPQQETTWTVEGRAKWLQAAANCFDLIYKGDGEITVRVAAHSHKTGSA